VAAWAVDGDLIAAAAEGLGDGGFRSRAVKDDVGGDAVGVRRILVDVADPAKVAFAFFANVAYKYEGGAEGHPGV